MEPYVKGARSDCSAARESQTVLILELIHNVCYEARGLSVFAVSASAPAKQ